MVKHAPGVHHVEAIEFIEQILVEDVALGESIHVNAESGCQFTSGHDGVRIEVERGDLRPHAACCDGEKTTSASDIKKTLPFEVHDSEEVPERGFGLEKAILIYVSREAPPVPAESESFAATHWGPQVGRWRSSQRSTPCLRTKSG